MYNFCYASKSDFQYHLNTYTIRFSENLLTETLNAILLMGSIIYNTWADNNNTCVFALFFSQANNNRTDRSITFVYHYILLLYFELIYEF